VSLYLISIRLSEANLGRMQELMEQSNDGALGPEERYELDGYVNIANVLPVMHLRARSSLAVGDKTDSLAVAAR
jgi:hypothetical protein